MKALVTDFTFPNLEVEEAILRPTGAEFVSGQYRTREQLLPVVVDADVVITQFASLTAEVIGAMSKAKAIVRYGIGVDNIDLDAAKAKGIPVANVPDYCIDEVADHTLAFMLGLTRQVVSNCVSLRAGKWGLATPFDEMCPLRDRTRSRSRPSKVPKIESYQCTRDWLRSTSPLASTCENVLSSD